jgi:hypothetical protein
MKWYNHVKYLKRVCFLPRFEFVKDLNVVVNWWRLIVWVKIKQINIYFFLAIIRQDYLPFTQVLEKPVLHATSCLRQVACFKWCYSGGFLWIKCVLRMTLFCSYEWSWKFIRYYKKKVLTDNFSVCNFFLKHDWYVICKKKNQTPVVVTLTGISGNCLMETHRASLLL